MSGAYLAEPAGTGRHGGVIVGMEMFGVTAYVRSGADRIAALGYTAYAPDFYRRVAPGIELAADDAGGARGLELAGALTRAQALEDLREAVDLLRARDDPTGAVAMVGMSFGGHIAYLAATQLDVATTVVFYGGWLTGTDIALSRPQPTLALTPGIAAPLLDLVGDSDHAVPAADVAQIGAALADAGVEHELVVYPDTPDGFFCDVRDSYRPSQAADAWVRMQRALGAQPRRDEQGSHAFNSSVTDRVYSQAHANARRRRTERR
jgi:carboxymethylenebutenolidase